MRVKIVTPNFLFIALPILLLFMLSKNSLGQEYTWQIDTHPQQEEGRKQKQDSLLRHLDNKWKLSLSYGQWFFDESAESKVVSLIDFPRNMDAWSLSLDRHFTENIAVNFNVGLQIKKMEPQRPNIGSILGGADIDLEGGGIVLVPISVGMDYFFLKKRFRPFVGFGVGAISGTYKYIEAGGNLFNGINRNEKEFSSNTQFAEISTGFVYRAGPNVQLGVNCDYVQSGKFKEDIGDYSQFNGFKISAVFSVVF